MQPVRTYAEKNTYNDTWRVRQKHADGTRTTLKNGFVDEDAANAWISELDIEADIMDAPTLGDAVPRPVQLIERQPITLDLDVWLYCSDIHAPLHSTRFLHRLVDVARSQRVRDLVIGGDLFDFQSVSRHPKTERLADLNQTLRIGGDVLWYLLQTFDRVYVLPGNHDQRVAKMLDQPLSFDLLISAAIQGRARVSDDPQDVDARIITTDFDYLYVGPQETGYVVGHPRFYSKTPKALTDVATLQRRHALGSHNHLQGVMWSTCGTYVAIDPGMMCEPSLTPYLMQTAGMSRFPRQKQGFVLIRDGVPTLCADGLVHWQTLGTV